MGDMADFAIDCSFDELEHYEKYCDADENTQYDKGLIDEYGGTIGNPGSLPFTASSKKQYGAGKCPRCGEATILKEGAYGPFYGCVNFPVCKGSRNT